jgi:protein-disulfide isomerase
LNSRRATRLLATLLLGTCSFAHAAADGSKLEIPQDADVAIVVFEDLQCPDCARAHPQLLEASRASKVPLVIHDFPIQRHVWAFPAAVMARYITAQSPDLGADFRSFIFENQGHIRSDNLRQFGERFASEHELKLPGDVDPHGKLAARVQADYDLGIEIGLEYVPLIFVVRRGDDPGRALEVTDTAELGAVIARMRKDVQQVNDH